MSSRELLRSNLSTTGGDLIRRSPALESNDLLRGFPFNTETRIIGSLALAAAAGLVGLFVGVKLYRWLSGKFSNSSLTQNKAIL